MNRQKEHTQLTRATAIIINEHVM